MPAKLADCGRCSDLGFNDESPIAIVVNPGVGETPLRSFLFIGLGFAGKTLFEDLERLAR